MSTGLALLLVGVALAALPVLGAVAVLALVAAAVLLWPVTRVRRRPLVNGCLPWWPFAEHRADAGTVR